jgi:CTP:molybdopterin cytidylyltransferase MocA
VNETILVLGFAADAVEKEISTWSMSTQAIKIVHNGSYQQGMGTSLREGLAAVSPDAIAALIVLADQPFVRPSTLDQLMECHRSSGRQIIIPTFRGFRGNPVLLDRSVFPELRGLSGDMGCRAIFGSHTEGILKLPVDDAGILLDVDSHDDFRKLRAAGVEDKAARNSPGAILESKQDIPSGRPELVLVGCDAVVRTLAQFGRLLNFTVTVVDPWLPLAEFPAADRLLHALDFSLLPEAAERYAVVASRGQFDEDAIAQALHVNIPYVALLANKKRAQELSGSLRVQSIAAEKLAAIRAPAGLEIGAATPEEIALSIMAEIVEVRRQQEKNKS